MHVATNPEVVARSRDYVFLLTEGMSMLVLASAIDPLRSANRLLGRDVYRWHLTSFDGQPVMSSSGIALAAEPVDQLVGRADILFVCGGLRISSPRDKDHVRLLREAGRAGIALGGLSTGVYLLARAGVLRGRKCTTHWESAAAFKDEFPDLLWSTNIYEIDGDRLTCCGGTAVIDMMLHLIGEHYGPALSAAVANQYHHDRIRPSGVAQRSGDSIAIDHASPILRKAITLMEANLEEPLSLEEIARRAGGGVRQLQRLFLRTVGQTPIRYYIGLRLELARDLLMYTSDGILDIAVRVGFSSSSHFNLWFRRRYGVSPSQMRLAMPKTLAL